MPLLVRPVQIAAAQGVASGSIRGTVRSPDGVGLDGASVRVVNTATGFTTRSQVMGDRFLAQGLEPGGPYVVEVRHIGFLPQRSRPLPLTLGEPLAVAFVLQPSPVQLETVEVTGAAPDPTPGGAATTIPEAMVRRLPTLNRNFYDFVALAPHVSTKIGLGRNGVSGAGANLRFNSFLIDGADERFVNGSVSAASNVGKSVPLDAVKEYQVLVAPYDVRFGDFAGAVVNTVTQSGTNEFRGSAFTYWRNDQLARGGVAGTGTAYDRLQAGFSLGGPIVRDRLHFFIAPEVQRLTEPAPGPYVGQPSTHGPPLPVAETDLVRLEEIMRRRYGLASGSARYVENGTPLVNLFARVDAAFPSLHSRAMMFVTYARTREDEFSRSADTLSLSTYRFNADVGLRLTTLRVDTDLPRAGGGHNRLLVSHTADHSDLVPDVHQPLVRVTMSGIDGRSVLVNAGSAEPAHGRFGREWSFRIRDEISLPLMRNQVLTAGVQVERFRVRRGGVRGGYGIWSFSGLDALEFGTASRYELRKDFGSASAPLQGGQYAVYLGDEWRASERLALTLGLRADLLDIDGHAPYNPEVDSIFGRRTDRMPRGRVHLSPRLGFTWDLSEPRRERLRGGVGLFTGRPPLAWLLPALANHGEGIGLLRCSLLPGANAPPAFEPDYRAAPTQCATGPAVEAAPFGDVDLLDRDLRMAQTLRASLAYERQLPGGLLAGVELLASRHVSDFVWVNLNLEGPQAVDRFGRVLYGTLN
ncbi:MAG: TonB-dependent receptor, partial [Chloroflexota bacterium]|nr:TonB-dependent receptor [Chloroflexota bacterium]